MPVPADIKEFVAEIAGDKFDAQDNPLTNIYNFGVHKFHRYITATGHFFGASAFALNQSVYENWPADVRTAVDAAARAATRYQHELAAAEDAAMLARAVGCDNEVIALTAAEQAAFVGTLAPVSTNTGANWDPRSFRLLDGRSAP